jgi:tRNA threonylcarbamoyladenosine biosynthesis protein TsaE
MAQTLEITTHSAEATQDIGRALGALTQAGDLILLNGTLGAGKTTLTQGIAWGLGVEEYAHSPTFILVHEYHGRVKLHHLDLYRIDDPREVEELGIDEFLTDSACVVEWAEKAIDLFPEEHLLVELTELSEGNRSLRLTPTGERYVRLVEEIARGLGRAG